MISKSCVSYREEAIDIKLWRWKFWHTWSLNFLIACLSACLTGTTKKLVGLASLEQILQSNMKTFFSYRNKKQYLFESAFNCSPVIRIIFFTFSGWGRWVAKANLNYIGQIWPKLILLCNINTWDLKDFCGIGLGYIQEIRLLWKEMNNQLRKIRNYKNCKIQAAKIVAWMSLLNATQFRFLGSCILHWSMQNQLKSKCL